MLEQQTMYEFRSVGDGDKTAKTDLFYKEEIQLALRNRGMPLEGLHYDITPTGMHYLLIHFDIPVANEEAMEPGNRRPPREPGHAGDERHQVASVGDNAGDDGVRRKRPCPDGARARSANRGC